MADTTFIDKVTHVLASWLNEVNIATHRAIGVGGIAPTTAGDVRLNLGLSTTLGAGLIGKTGSGSVQTFIDLIGSTAGAANVGVTAGGLLSGVTVKAQLAELNTEKAKLAGGNTFTAVSGIADQYLEYTIPTVSTSNDHACFTGLVHDAGSNPDNLTPLRGHSYHDRPFNNLTGGYWGVVTEAWSNASGGGVLIGGECAVIQQYPVQSAPSVGLNAVFKNRSDGATRPVAAIADGALYNRNSTGLFVSSQQRPSNPTFAGVGSGFQAAIRIGDPGYPALDWEGGDFFPGSSTYKAYSTIVDVTNCLQDMAHGFPWAFLYRNSITHWGMRFNGQLTGELHTYNFVIVAGGAGYAAGNRGTIGGAGGNTATYEVTNVVAGAVTGVAIVRGSGGSGYVAAAGVATTATTGGGAGMTLTITVGIGMFFGADLAIAAGGAGYFVGEYVTMDAGTAGYRKPVVKVTAVAAGVVTGILLQSEELQGWGGVSGYVNGRGFATGAGATTSLTGVGAGLTINVTRIYADTLIGGEKWEFWRMTNPSDPIGTGARHGWIDSSYPGTPLTIDTSGATYTFPIDRPL